MASRLPLVAIVVGSLLLLAGGAAVAGALTTGESSEALPGVAPLTLAPTTAPTAGPTTPPAPAGTPEAVTPAAPHDVGDRKSVV